MSKRKTGRQQIATRTARALLRFIVFIRYIIQTSGHSVSERVTRSQLLYNNNNITTVYMIYIIIQYRVMLTPIHRYQLNKTKKIRPRSSESDQNVRILPRDFNALTQTLFQPLATAAFLGPLQLQQWSGNRARGLINTLSTTAPAQLGWLARGKGRPSGLCYSAYEIN